MRISDTSVGELFQPAVKSSSFVKSHSSSYIKLDDFLIIDDESNKNHGTNIENWKNIELLKSREFEPGAFSDNTDETDDTQDTQDFENENINSRLKEEEDDDIEIIENNNDSKNDFYGNENRNYNHFDHNFDYYVD